MRRERIGGKATATGTEKTSYNYDDNDRLLAETGPTDTTTYGYDANGSLIERDAPDGTVTYTRNDDNRLVSADAGNQSITYSYDIDGIRQSKTVDGNTTGFLVDSNRDYAEVLAEKDSAGNALVRYTHAQNLIAQSQGGEAAYYHADALGSTRLLSNSTGAESDSYVYKAFGKTEVESGDTHNMYRFTGEVLDRHLELYYLRARYMDPNTGRFEGMDSWHGRTTDPITLQKYLYANADPAQFIDPSGNVGLLL